MTLTAPGADSLAPALGIYDQLVYDILEATEPPEAARELRSLRAAAHPASQLRALYRLPVAAYAKSMAAQVKTKQSAIQFYEILATMEELINKNEFLYDMLGDYAHIVDFDNLPDDLLAYGTLLVKRVSGPFEGPRYVAEPLKEFILILHMLNERENIVDPYVSTEKLSAQQGVLTKYVALAAKMITYQAEERC